MVFWKIFKSKSFLLFSGFAAEQHPLCLEHEATLLVLVLG